MGLCHSPHRLCLRRCRCHTAAETANPIADAANHDESPASVSAAAALVTTVTDTAYASAKMLGATAAATDLNGHGHKKIKSLP